MCRDLGIPDAQAVEALLTLPCLKNFWTGNDEAVKDEKIDRSTLSNVAQMHRNKGLADPSAVDDFLRLSCLREDWTGNDEAVKNESFNWRVFDTITEMCDGLGLPDLSELQAFLEQPLPERALVGQRRVGQGQSDRR